MTTSGITELDIWAPDFQLNPYPVFEQLHAHSPILRLTSPDAWMMTRHADVSQALRTPTLYSSAQGVTYRPGGGQTSLVGTDDPDHRRLRSILSGEFTPRGVKTLERQIDDVVSQLVGEIVATKSVGSFDFASLFAEQLPTRVIATYLGIDPEHWDSYRRWSEMFNAMSWIEDPDEDLTNQIITAVREAVACFGSAIRERENEPRNDLIGRMVTAMQRHGTLSETEIIDFCSLLMLAGNATTSSVLNHAILLLIAHPNQLNELRADPTLLPAAIEEVIRFESPVQGFARRLTADTSLHGHTMYAGDTVLMMFGAANRDADVFPEPDQFDIHRDTRSHIGFGTGPHVCLGAWLARMEIRSALAQLIPFLGEWSIDLSTVQRRLDLPAFRDLISLPVAWRS